jgi:hypothetical protein
LSPGWIRTASKQFTVFCVMNCVLEIRRGFTENLLKYENSIAISEEFLRFEIILPLGAFNTLGNGELTAYLARFTFFPKPRFRNVPPFDPF